MPEDAPVSLLGGHPEEVRQKQKEEVRQKEEARQKTERRTQEDRPPSATRHIKVIRPQAFSFGTIFAGLRTLVHYSDLFYTLSVFRLNVRYKQSVLGWAWAAVQPIALMAIYTF